jgi:tRNA (cmo5U34)-methyltransferase
MSDIADQDHWTEAESEGFIDWGDFFVPYRDEQMALVCALIPDIEGEIIDICSGQGLLSKFILEHIENARVRALDGSPAMLAATSATLEPFRGRFEVAQIEISQEDWRAATRQARAFVSSLAVHHLDGTEKLKFFKDLHRALAPGGALIIADVVRPAGSRGAQLAADLWDDAVRRRSLMVREDLSAFETFVAEEWNMFSNPLDAIDKPSTALEQLNWLVAAGFRDVDIHWMNAGHAIFAGYK